MGRTSSSSAAPTTASAARTTLKRSTPDEDLDAVVRGSDHYSASTSALPAASGSTTSLRSTIVAARHARPLGTSLSSISMGQSNRSMSTSAVLEGEMTVAEMSESMSVGPGPAPLPSMSLDHQRRPSRPPSAATSSASGGAPVVTGRLSELSSNSSRSGSGYGGARAGVSVPGGARRPSYGVAAAAARVPSYERRMLPA
ncbi:unnamed protein product [Tilletia laevis]|nr:unnamed protein product [Tilletia laevis]CAD6959049.1 unnamed protein product [Tilletia laevis]